MFTAVISDFGRHFGKKCLNNIFTTQAQYPQTENFSALKSAKKSANFPPPPCYHRVKFCGNFFLKTITFKTCHCNYNCGCYKDNMLKFIICHNNYLINGIMFIIFTMYIIFNYENNKDYYFLILFKCMAHNLALKYSF